MSAQIEATIGVIEKDFEHESKVVTPETPIPYNPKDSFDRTISRGQPAGDGKGSFPSLGEFKNRVYTLIPRRFRGNKSGGSPNTKR